MLTSTASVSYLDDISENTAYKWSHADKKKARKSLREGGIKDRKVQNCIIYKLEQRFENFEEADKQEGQVKQDQLVKIMQACLELKKNSSEFKGQRGKFKKNNTFKRRNKKKPYRWSDDDVAKARKSLSTGGITDLNTQNCIIDKLQREFKSFSEADSNDGGKEKDDFLVELMLECLNDGN